MPSIGVNSPVSSAPTDRLTLGVGWVRPGAGCIADSLNPSTPPFGKGAGSYCFEGSEE
jgi:hypothetical protein